MIKGNPGISVDIPTIYLRKEIFKFMSEYKFKRNFKHAIFKRFNQKNVISGLDLFLFNFVMKIIYQNK